MNSLINRKKSLKTAAQLKSMHGSPSTANKYGAKLALCSAWTHQSCQEIRFGPVDGVLPTLKRQTNLSVMSSSISVSWRLT